jgi:hypothetical protein
MKLLTKEIEKKLPKLYATDGQKDKDVIFKVFDPCSAVTWYILEGEKREDGDWEFFNYMTGVEFPEYGYVTLSQLEEFRNVLGIGLERDMYFEIGTPLQEVI